MEEYDYTYAGLESYCYPGTDVLINKLGIKDDDALIIAEREISSLKLLMLHEMPVITKFNFLNLCKIHKIIFGDIYEWAGKRRHGDFLSKGNSVFCRGLYITESADKVFDNLLKEKNLCDLKKPEFVDRMAYYMGEINALHPFREGNGRTVREFFRQLALNAHYELDFSKINKDDLLMADIEAFNGRYENLIKIMHKSLSAD